MIYEVIVELCFYGSSCLQHSMLVIVELMCAYLRYADHPKLKHEISCLRPQLHFISNEHNVHCLVWYVLLMCQDLGFAGYLMWLQ